MHQEQLRRRSVVLQVLVLFAGGVAFGCLLFVAIGERPPPIVILGGIPVALSGGSGRPRKPDEDWIESSPGASRDDGRRWRTGTP